MPQYPDFNPGQAWSVFTSQRRGQSSGGPQVWMTPTFPSTPSTPRSTDVPHQSEDPSRTTLLSLEEIVTPVPSQDVVPEQEMWSFSQPPAVNLSWYQNLTKSATDHGSNTSSFSSYFSLVRNK